MKAPAALQRGMACLCCRKRKMKCDGARPVCGQCSKANRGPECQYYEKKRTSRTQLLQAKITKLEARLRELEAEQSPLDSSSSSGSQSPQIDRASVALQHQPELDLGFDASAFSTPELDHDFLLGGGDSFPNTDDDSFFPGFQGSSSLATDVVGWSANSFQFPPAVDHFLASYPSNSSTSSLHDRSSGSPSSPASNWWENDVFCENKQLLLDIFFAHRHQCAFDVHIGRFKAALLLPNLPDAQKPHPSLVDAIYLLACYFSRSPPLTELEPHFLKQSLKGIADALQYSDRIVHVLQASCLLALYFFWHGRTLEGYYHSSIAARLAVGLGLHQIRSKEWLNFQLSRPGHQNEVPAPLKDSVPLNPPRDEVEYAERIAAFWQIFAVDRAWAVTTGLPTALPDDDHPRSEIKTIWPMAIPDDGQPTLENSHLSGSSPLVALRVRVIELFERTARISASSARDDGYSLEVSLSQFLKNLSNLRNQQYSLPYLVSNADIVAMETLLHTATIHLHRDSLEIQRHSYEKCYVAASAITALIGQLTESDYDLMSAIISACWRSAAEVYLRMLAMHHSQSMLTNAELVEQQIDILVSAMQRLGCLFPIARIHAATVQEDRAASRQPYLPSLV